MYRNENKSNVQRHYKISQGTLYGQYQRLSEAFPPLTQAEEWILANRASRGDKDAQRKLFLHNSRRLLMFACRYGQDPENPSPDGPPRTIDEVLCWAAQALWYAVTRYDPGKCHRFSPWANHVIMGRIRWEILTDFHSRQRNDKALEAMLPSPHTFLSQEATASMTEDNAAGSTEFASRKIFHSFNESANNLKSPEEIVEREWAEKRFIELCQSLPEEDKHRLLDLVGLCKSPITLKKIKQPHLQSWLSAVTEKLREQCTEKEWERLKRVFCA